MKKLRQLMVCLFLLWLFAGPTMTVLADSEGLAISIQKFKIEDAKVISEQFPQDGHKADKVTDKDGRALEPLAGITYEITRVSPVSGGTNKFQAVEGADAFTTTVTTDETGSARVANLAQGTYRVVETPNPKLKEVMEPVILELPLPQRTGEALKEVYLYPKSSVVGELPKTNGPDVSDQGKRLPQTSGNIGTYQSLAMIFAFVLFVGVAGIQVMQRRKHPY